MTNKIKEILSKLPTIGAFSGDVLIKTETEYDLLVQYRGKPELWLVTFPSGEKKQYSRQDLIDLAQSA